MLKTRIITAVISLLVLGVVLFVAPPWAADVLIALVVLVGAWEWAGFLNIADGAARLIYVVLVGALAGSLHFVFPQWSMLVLQVGCAWWLVAFLWTFFFPTAIPMPVRWMCGLLVLVPLYVAVTGLYLLSPKFLLFSLVIVWAADMGAYFAGKIFGKVKLAPSISPGKTWEGVFGGLALVIALAFAWADYADLNPMVWLPFCLAIAALSVVGDLTVSMFKRTSGVKDSGRLFPGHGGVLDRIDSISATAPLFALGLSVLGLIG